MKEEFPKSPEKIQIPVAESKKVVENHKLAATHHEQAAKHHLDAAKHQEEGNHEKACVSSVKANGHSCCATDTAHEGAKLHATKNA